MIKIAKDYMIESKIRFILYFRLLSTPIVSRSKHTPKLRNYNLNKRTGRITGSGKKLGLDG